MIIVGQLKAALEHFDFDDDDEVILAWEEWSNDCCCGDCGTDMGRDMTETCIAIGELAQKKAKNPKNKLILGATSYMTTQNSNQKVNDYKV